ncbi:MAG: isopenicillin N synthase family dioxygenase [Bradymonadia bacterium]
MSEQTIPVVSLEDWTSGDADRRAHFAKTVGDALTDLGFFALTNHGVDQDLIKNGYAEVQSFFDLPEAAKKAYELAELNGQRGYISVGREHAKDHPVPDLKEFWHVGPEIPTDSPHHPAQNYARNLWPAELPQFKPTLLELYGQLERCAGALLEACAIYAGEPEGLFRDMAIGGDTILRTIHYPPVAEDAHPAAIRAAAHEDINLITLLVESTDEGLELLQRDGTWRPIHALDGHMVVDSGDMLQHITNGLFKSTTHRVVNPADDRSRRFSMPFFVHPRGEVDLTPLPSCVAKTGGEVKYPNRTAREYLDLRLAEIGLKK